MNRVGKIVPPSGDPQDVSLSFFRAKIACRVNGSGKSTLLKIMAGLDKEIEASRADAGLTSLLAQEPELDPDQTVSRSGRAGIVVCWQPRSAGRGVRRVRRTRRRFDKLLLSRPNSRP
jgi:ATPase subunit of ABC transporter with duplicated ATPase domains